MTSLLRFFFAYEQLAFSWEVVRRQLYTDISILLSRVHSSSQNPAFCAVLLNTTKVLENLSETVELDRVGETSGISKINT